MTERQTDRKTNPILSPNLISPTFSRAGYSTCSKCTLAFHTLHAHIQLDKHQESIQTTCTLALRLP